MYGQAPVPGQMGVTYIVFHVHHNQVVGGVYTPRSSFDCFYGKTQGNQLQMRVTDSYTQIPYKYTVGLSPQGQIASRQNVGLPMQLAGYHPISPPSNVAKRVLATCQSDYQASINDRA